VNALLVQFNHNTFYNYDKNNIHIFSWNISSTSDFKLSQTQKLPIQQEFQKDMNKTWQMYVGLILISNCETQKPKTVTRSV